MEIDLFGQQVKKLARKQKAKRMALQLLIFLLLILAIAMIAISGTSLLVAKENQKTEDKIGLIKTKIDDLREIESKQVYLNSKLNSFESLLITHEKHQGVAEAVFNLIPSGTTLKGFDVSEDGVITLAGSVPNWEVLSQLLANVRGNKSGLMQIKEAKVKKIVFSQIGSDISFDISLVLSVNSAVNG